MANSKGLTTPKNGVWQIMLDLLADNFGELVNNQQLADATGQHNYARRLRELRAEGWKIKYAAKEKGYILTSLERLDTSADEYVNLRLRNETFERDDYTCQMCGYSKGELFLDGEPVKLEADHIIPLADNGKTVIDNLQTLCSRCNAGKKAVASYSVKDDKTSMVIRLDKSLVERLEAQAQTENIPIKELIQTMLEQDQ